MNVLNVEVQGVRVIVISGNPRPPESSPLNYVLYTYCFLPDGNSILEYRAKSKEALRISQEKVVSLIENVIVADGRK